MSFAAFCPSAPRIRLDSDYKEIIAIGQAMSDPGERPEIAAHGSDRKLLIRFPGLFRHDSGAVAAYVNCACEFEVWIV